MGSKSSSVISWSESFLVAFSEGTFSSSSAVSMTSFSSETMVGGVLGVLITGTWAASAEEESDEDTALGGEEILFFSKNVCLLNASLRRSLGDLFFDLLPRLGNPVLVFKELSIENLNLESPRFTSKAAFPLFILVMSLARSRHFSRIKGGK